MTNRTEKQQARALMAKNPGLRYTEALRVIRAQNDQAKGAGS